MLARILFEHESSRDLAHRLIREARVVTVPGEQYGPGGEGHLRLSFGGTGTEIKTSFDRLENWLRANVAS